MRTTRLFPAIALLTCTLLFEGCLEIDVQTKISPDGSSDRVITILRDSESLPKSAFPVPADPSWTTEWKKTGKDTAKYEYIARKHFGSPEELSGEYSAIPDTSPLRVSINIEKRFEWFYSYIRYKETYELDNPFRQIPITTVLTESEIESYRRGLEDDSIKARVDKWFMRNIFEDFFTGAVQNLKEKNDPTLPASRLTDGKEFLYNIIINDSGPEDVDALLRLLEKIMNTKSVYSLKDEFDVLWKGIEAKSEKLSDADGSYTNSAELPGLVLDTNSDEIEGSRITWKFTSDQLRIGAYEMHAESRVTNVWAFIATGVLIVFIIAILIIKLRRF